MARLPGPDRNNWFQSPPAWEGGLVEEEREAGGRGGGGLRSQPSEGQRASPRAPPLSLCCIPGAAHVFLLAGLTAPQSSTPRPPTVIDVGLDVTDRIVRKLWGFTVEASYLEVGFLSNKGVSLCYSSTRRLLHAASGWRAGLGFAVGKGGC